MPSNLPESPLTSNETEKLTESSVLDSLSTELEEEDNETETEETPSKQDDSSDSEDEEDSDESEEAEVKIESKDEDLEDLRYTNVPTRDTLKKAYPDIFKKYPELDRAIYREKAYTEIFPSIKEAKTAASDLRELKSFESEVNEGNLETVLNTVRQNNPKAFEKMTGGILQTLHKVDEKAYYGVANHIIKHTLKVAEAFGTEDKSEDGEQLVIAAKLINKFIYKTTKIDDPPQIQATEQKEDPEKEKFQREKSEFNQQRLNAATSDVGGRITKDIERAVNKYIDPRGSMNDYTKERAVKDVMSRLDSEIGKDPRFKAVMGQLWKKASENGFPEDVKKQIHQNAINKAQTLLAGIIKGVRSEALKGQGKKVSLSPKKSEDDETSERRSSPPKQSSSKYDKEKEKPRARSVNDVMNFLNKG